MWLILGALLGIGLGMYLPIGLFSRFMRTVKR